MGVWVRPIVDVLIVDDDRLIVKLARFMLERAGLTVETWDTGAGAYEYIRDIQPRVVLLDVMLPGESGPGVFERLQCNPATAHISVVFCTAAPDLLNKEVPNYEARGAALVIKPFNLTGLVATVRWARDRAIAAASKSEQPVEQPAIAHS